MAHNWVVADKDITVLLVGTLALPSNFTVDGRGHHVVIDGQLTYACLAATDQTNIVIESVTVTRCGDPAKTVSDTPLDAINLWHTSHVWLDHLDLSFTGDKVLAVQGGSTGITLSWSHLHDQEQNIEVGDYYDRDTAGVQTITLHHNWYDHVGYRLPSVSYGTAHSYDNFYDSWGAYGSDIRRGAHALMENNVCLAGDKIKCAVLNPGSPPKDKDPSPGFILARGNLLENGAVIKTDPTGVTEPPYTYTAELADTGLAARIVAQAGPI